MPERGFVPLRQDVLLEQLFLAVRSGLAGNATLPQLKHG